MTITKERLLKIQHWRETYGADSNVMLPAEEAEELARIALASLTAEPVAWKYRLVDIDSGAEDHWKYSTQCITPASGKTYRIESIPLYTVSQPVPERERIRREHAEWSYDDPVVFTDERNLHHIARGRETSLIWGKQNQEVGDIPLYRHAQPVPVVPEERPSLNNGIVGFDEGWNACRAAMLNGGKS
ncbi:TPA_asm: hypothetical protein G0D79_10775 [Salmonella enterica subsp. diarizonae]|nr:hypothetical protein [Salmonella enterica]EDD0453852.1 hypothetical protein [Salmonella enterica subsp. diarizonae]EIB1834522.1 hypothetical protein [Salmonella enterica]EKR1624333.1 hypothetical protein [Salmonella enterica subsp. diarizonae serovar 50:k:z:[z50],[z57],[z68], [z86]]HAC6773755.1 hypothetical protein [Salmonella enterica subsp. diarizonae]